MTEKPSCHCYECWVEYTKHKPLDWSTGFKYFTCPKCGNKRCPHATDHRLPCGNSNEPGQLGSMYGVYPHPYIELIEFLGKKTDDDPT